MTTNQQPLTDAELTELGRLVEQMPEGWILQTWIRGDKEIKIYYVFEDCCVSAETRLAMNRNPLKCLQAAFDASGD